mmetsp:Transcript_8544/g.22490  ORF Transcript_8544/g.22490 Transcript_8544/m.22490 type:complete len:161 (+) Transcript_8544:1126-1608(+)
MSKALPRNGLLIDRVSCSLACTRRKRAEAGFRTESSDAFRGLKIVPGFIQEEPFEGLGLSTERGRRSNRETIDGVDLHDPVPPRTSEVPSEGFFSVLTVVFDTICGVVEGDGVGEDFAGPLLCLRGVLATRPLCKWLGEASENGASRADGACDDSSFGCT